MVVELFELEHVQMLNCVFHAFPCGGASSWILFSSKKFLTAFTPAYLQVSGSITGFPTGLAATLGGLAEPGADAAGNGDAS